MKTIEQHLKNIKRIQRRAKIQKSINNIKCFFGFHNDYILDENGGVFSDNQCINCRNFTNKL